jgi:hypothetical protein
MHSIDTLVRPWNHQPRYDQLLDAQDDSIGAHHADDSAGLISCLSSILDLVNFPLGVVCRR